jgi:sugar lactone lactonase YvrE
MRSQVNLAQTILSGDHMKKIKQRLGATTLAVAVTAVLVLSGCQKATKAPTYRVEALIESGSPFHGVHGLRFDPAGTLYAVSVIGRSMSKVDVKTGAVTVFVPPPQGMGDDLAIGPDGTIVWNAIEDGIVYARDPDGTIRHLMDNQRGVNGVSFSPDGKRLFVSLVFYGGALYEMDVTGKKPPRQVAQDLGGLNAFGIDKDGMIYGPVATQHRMVRVNPETGEATTVSTEFEAVGAVKVRADGTAYVLDNGSKELKQVVLATGKTTTLARLPASGDNFDIDAKGHVFYSVSDQNAIVEVDPTTGESHYVVQPTPLNSPSGLVVETENGHDTIYVGDLFGGVRKINGETRAIETLPVRIFQPTHLAFTAMQVVVTSEPSGLVQLHDRKSGEVVSSWKGFSRPGDALIAGNGDVIVADSGTGQLLRLTSADTASRKVVADKLAGPKGLAWAGDDAVYVTETDGGGVTHVDLASGKTTSIANGLAQPEGIAVAPDGTLVVVEVAAKRVTRVDPKQGTQTVIAADLPLGLANGLSMYRGVAVSASAIYVSSDVKNGLYKLTLER